MNKKAGRPKITWETKRISVPVALIPKVKQMIKIWEGKNREPVNDK